MVNRTLLIIVTVVVFSVFVALLVAGSVSSKNSSVTITNNSVISLELENGNNQTNTEKDNHALSQFRKMLNPEELYASFMTEDSYLIDWIRDADYDLKKAAGKLSKSLKWRLKNNIDEILEDDYPEIRKYCPYNTNARDINGNIVGVIPIGSWKLRKVGLTGKTSRLSRYILSEFERSTTLARELREKTGKNIRIIGIIDFKGFSIMDQGCVKCIPVLSGMINVYQDHYPGYMKSWYMINVSTSGQRFLDILLPLHSPKTRAITKIFGNNEKEWGSELLKSIPKEQFPRLQIDLNQNYENLTLNL